ncbi:MAG: hypothetical protein NZ821_09965, partial [Gloeomargarita sp. SKYB31]|nr:hypothetical protein [Gloeomargarita sp. SKYB31]
NNNQAFKGGGIYAGDGSTITAQQNLGGFSPKILNNQSVLGGGGIFAKDSTLTLKDSTLISGNTAGGWGGGIRLLDSTAILKDNVKILSNTAKFGGGIYVGGISTLTFTDSTVQVQGNTATQPTPSGGGIFIFKLGSTPSTVPPATLPPNVAIPGPATQVTGNSPDNIVVGPLGP